MGGVSGADAAVLAACARVSVDDRSLAAMAAQMGRGPQEFLRETAISQVRTGDTQPVCARHSSCIRLGWSHFCSTIVCSEEAKLSTPAMGSVSALK